MSNVGKLNIYSEDIFQSCSEPSESNLRRSQRILEKKLNINGSYVCSENNLLNYLSENSNASLPPNQLELKNIGELHQCSGVKVEHIDGEITPDFTYMLYAENTSTNQLEASQKRISTSVDENPKDLFDESYPIDLRLISNKDVQPNGELKTIRRKAVRKRKMCTATPKENAKKVSQNKIPIENSGSFDAYAEEKTKNPNTLLQDEKSMKTECKKSFQLEKATDESIQLKEIIQTMEANVCAKDQEPYKCELPREVTSEINSTHENKHVKLSQKCSTDQIAPNIVKTKRQSNRSQSSNSKRRRGRPLMGKTKIKAQQQKAKESIPITVLKDYVAPKVVRYYNSCPTMQAPYTSDINTNNFYTTNNRSLLPAVYPPHFTQQIIASDVNKPSNISIPISYLTPENSQLAVVETKISASSPTPSSENSLREFFELEELCEILNTDKTVYRLTELHVRALALTLNVNVDNLVLIIDKIVELDENILSEKCTMYGKQEEEEEAGIFFLQNGNPMELD